MRATSIARATIPSIATPRAGASSRQPRREWRATAFAACAASAGCRVLRDDDPALDDPLAQPR